MYMYKHICMYIYMHVYVYVFIYVNIFIYYQRRLIAFCSALRPITRMRQNELMSTYTYIYVCIYMCTYMYTYM